MIEYQNLSWISVIGYLEVSGSLSRYLRSKEWDDILKLELELWDLWTITKDQLMSIDISKLIWWGLIVIGKYCNLKMQTISWFIVIYKYINVKSKWKLGHKIRVYAFVATGSLFHLVLMYEAFLSSFREDLYNLELCYLILKEYKKKLNETKNMLCELN